MPTLSKPKPTTIEDFSKDADPKQKKVLDWIMKLAKEEYILAEYINEKAAKWEEKGRREYAFWCPSFVQIYDLIMDQEIGPAAHAETYRERRRFETVRRRMNVLFVAAVEKYDMGHLGFIQRNYEKAVGKPIQTATQV